MRGLQEFQTKHPEVVLVALSTDKDRKAIENLLARQKLETLRVAIGTEWQEKFGMSDAIPATVVVDRGRVRVIHDGVLTDPVEMLEADIAALRAEAAKQ